MATFRRAIPQDTAALVELNALADTADAGAGYTPATDAAGEQAGPDLAENGWLAEAGPGQVAGYSRVEMVVEPGRVNFWLHGTVHPGWRGQGVGRELIRRNWADMRLLSRDYPGRPAVVFAWAYQQDEPRRRLFARFGLQPYHIYHELVLPAARLGPAPPVSPGIAIQPWRDSHCELAVSLRNRAFAESWGYQPTTARALRRCFNTGRYEPEFTFTAWEALPISQQRMIGLIHCCLGWTRKLRQANEAEIVWLAVAPEARGQGVGRALVVAAINKLREAGVETVSVGADNPAGSLAPGVYTGLGFTVRKAIVDYQGELGHGLVEEG